MHTHPKCSDEEFISLFTRHGARKTGELIGMSERSVYKRRKKLPQFIAAPTRAPLITNHPERVQLEIKNGYVIIGSDFHIWPGADTPILKTFKKLCKDLKPAAVILNGDVLDFAQISRHSPIMWGNLPLPVEELEAAQDNLSDIAKACGHAHKVWNVGNHDSRFESFLAQHAAQMKGVKGSSLHDHFGLWPMGWSCWINGEVVVKHRWKGGIHAVYNNTVNSGKTMITGHLHSQKVIPFTDYNGTRYGIDTGCVADPNHKAFLDYTEDNPKNWISGFVVLKFVNGRLLYPELVSAWDHDSVQFRGEILKV